MFDTRPEAGVATAGSDRAVPPGQRELRYEGFPLEAVLARVHAAHGADVTITGADRVRKGGIGGFFARELFQVTVTVPVPSDEPNFVPIGRISIFDDLPEVIGEERDYDEIDPEDVAGALSLEPAPVRDDADAEIWALLAAAATATSPVAPTPPVAAPTAAASLPAPAVPAPSVAVPAVTVPEVVAPMVVAPIESSGPIASTTLIPASSVVGTPFDPALATPGLASPVLPVTTQLRPSAEVVAHGHAGSGPIRAGERVDLNDLIARYETVPPAPPLPDAGVVAVIGSRAEALEVAGRLADRLGIPTDDVIVASPPADIVVPSAEDATRLAATTRYRCTPVAVIVLELVPGRQGHEWVRVVLDGLRAEQVRLAVDTGRLLAHQHLSIAAVGGVDVIDLLGATDHPSPAEALDLPTPVATIDGRPASPELWAATVLASRAPGVPTVDRSGVTGR